MKAMRSGQPLGGLGSGWDCAGSAAFRWTIWPSLDSRPGALPWSALCRGLRVRALAANAEGPGRLGARSGRRAGGPGLAALNRCSNGFITLLRGQEIVRSRRRCVRWIRPPACGGTARNVITSDDRMQSTRCWLSSQGGLMKADGPLMKTDNHGRLGVARPVNP
jgi:hypothetical protein